MKGVNDLVDRYNLTDDDARRGDAGVVRLIMDLQSEVMLSGPVLTSIGCTVVKAAVERNRDVFCKIPKVGGWVFVCEMTDRRQLAHGIAGHRASPRLTRA